MANTYTQMYVQIVFAVCGRVNVITEIHRNELEKYICGIISNNKCKPLSLYCNPDHIHILVGLHPAVSDTCLNGMNDDQEISPLRGLVSDGD
jgi:REP element-mobilizing transposase RayT